MVEFRLSALFICPTCLLYREKLLYKLRELDVAITHVARQGCELGQSHHLVRQYMQAALSAPNPAPNHLKMHRLSRILPLCQTIRGGNKLSAPSDASMRPVTIKESY